LIHFYKRSDSKPEMKKAVSVLATFMMVASVRGWGGVFNRYNPSLLSNYDTSGNYYNMMTESRHTVKEPKVVERQIRELLEDEMSEPGEPDPCYEKKCTSNEHCCDGTVCVDTANTVTGTCLPMFGKKEGEDCYMDSDCETGYVCMEGYGGRRQCMEPRPGVAKFGEECRDSAECNIEKGLCCRLQRRHRMQPKKLCAYFTDPAICIGPVATHQVKNHIEHTAGEKRRSSHPDHDNLYYR